MNVPVVPHSAVAVDHVDIASSIPASVAGEIGSLGSHQQRHHNDVRQEQHQSRYSQRDNSRGMPHPAPGGRGGRTAGRPDFGGRMPNPRGSPQQVGGKHMIGQKFFPPQMQPPFQPPMAPQHYPQQMPFVGYELNCMS